MGLSLSQSNGGDRERRQRPLTTGFFFGASDGTEVEEDLKIFSYALVWLKEDDKGDGVNHPSGELVSCGGGELRLGILFRRTPFSKGNCMLKMLLAASPSSSASGHGRRPGDCNSGLHIDTGNGDLDSSRRGRPSFPA